jgi:hypothetical protein
MNKPGKLPWNLAAVYLNATFGFYDTYLPITINSGYTITNGAELVSHLWALHILNNGTDESSFGFSDGTTTYTATSGCI